MWQRLVVDHDLVVAKETVRHALRILDPEGVDERLRHRLQRRQYKWRGPNFLWHIDGFDKQTMNQLLLQNILWTV